MIKFSKLIFSLFFLSTVYCLLSTSASAACDPRLGPCAAGLNEIEGIFKRFISIAVYIGFIALFIMLIMGGFKYLTSSGEPKAIQSAHLLVSWALMGMLFMVISWLILQLIAVFTGLPVTVFDLKILTR
jgi:uncharacterized membrane protein